MNVLLCGVDHFGYLQSIACGFTAAGCRVELLSHERLAARKARLGWGPYRWWRGRAVRALNERVLAAAANADLVLLIEGSAIRRETVERLRERCPVALWCLDPVGRIPLDDGVAAAVTRLFSFEPADAERLPGCVYLPMACDPEVYHPLPDVRGEGDIVFVGSAHDNRLPILEWMAGAAAGAGLDFRVYGKYHAARLAGNWPHLAAAVAHDGPLRPAAVNDIYNRAPLVVNIHLDDPGNRGLNPRTFEVMAAGAFLLSDARPELERFFTPGVDFEVYHGPEDFVATAQRCLADPAERRRRAAAARERVLAGHTFAHRARTLLDALGLN